MTALIISSLDSRRARMASLREQEVWSITMSMCEGVMPSSLSGASSLAALVSSFFGAAALAAAYAWADASWPSANFLASACCKRVLGSSSLSSPKTANDLPSPSDLRTSGSLTTKIRPSLFLRVTRVTPANCFIPILSRAFLHFFSPRLSLGPSKRECQISHQEFIQKK